MIDYEISRCTRKCFLSGRELRPGEAVFSMLIEEGGNLVRRDCATEAWKGPPAEAIGWWRTRLPKPEGNAPRMAPVSVIVERFDRLVEQQADPLLISVFALLLVRKRLLKDDEGSDNDRNPSQWRLHCPLNNRVYELQRPEINPRHRDRLQVALVELLYGDDDSELSSSDD